LNNVEELNKLKYPLIVKCRHEGSSKGLSEESKVNNIDELKRQIKKINEVYQQPAIVEEFISGTEFTVAVLGNDSPKAMPVVQVSIDGDTELGEQFYTFERISSSSLRYVCPAQISKELADSMQQLALQVYKSVDCVDLGRVDFRVDDKGNPFVLEINPLPCLAKIDIFNLFPQLIGTTYDKTINQVVEYALRRYGLSDKSSDDEIEKWAEVSLETVASLK